MKLGLLRVATAAPHIRVADPAHNAGMIAAVMDDAYQESVRVLALPALCLTGATCGDLFLNRRLWEATIKGLLELVDHSRGMDMLTFVGFPLPMEGKVYNCAAALCDGKVLGIVPQSNPRDTRHFHPAPAANNIISLEGIETAFGPRLQFCCEALDSCTLSVEIGDDIWDALPPSASHAAAGSTIIIGMSADAEIAGGAGYRRRMVTGQSARLRVGYLFAGAGRGESTTDAAYSGHCFVVENGRVLAEAAPFGSGTALCELDMERIETERRSHGAVARESDLGFTRIGFSLPLADANLIRHIDPYPFVPTDPVRRSHRCHEVRMIQAHGIAKRVEHTGARTVVLGLSGGLDSTLALLAAADAFTLLGRSATEITAVTLPGFGTSGRTLGNARALCEALKIPLREIDITPSVRQHFADIGHEEENQNVVFENAQARERTQILMDLAQSLEGFMLGTGDLSEAALGFTTYGGDHLSMYNACIGVPKTLVRAMVAHAAETTENEALSVVLRDIVATPISPELLPDAQSIQRTESILGSYALHDFFLYYTVRWQFTAEKILKLAMTAFKGLYTDTEIQDALYQFSQRFVAAQFKRSCSPDGVRCGKVSLSPRGGFECPSDASFQLL